MVVRLVTYTTWLCDLGPPVASMCLSFLNCKVAVTTILTQGALMRIWVNQYL